MTAPLPSRLAVALLALGLMGAGAAALCQAPSFALSGAEPCAVAPSAASPARSGAAGPTFAALRAGERPQATEPERSGPKSGAEGPARASRVGGGAPSSPAPGPAPSLRASEPRAPSATRARGLLGLPASPANAPPGS